MEQRIVRRVVSPVEQDNDIMQTKTPEDSLLEFVEAEVSKMKGYCDFGKVPGFYELNQALLEYTPIQTALISLDAIAKTEAYQAKEDLEDWEARKYIEVKERLNPHDLAASKWCSSSEINAYVRNLYGDERKALADKVFAADAKVATVRRLLDAWDGQKLILNRLCKNIEVEAMQLGGAFIKPNDGLGY